MLTLAVAAHFELAEKLIDTLEQSQLQIKNVFSTEIFPFGEEQGLRFKNKAVLSQKPEEMDWSSIDYCLFAGESVHIPLMIKASQAGCIVIDINGFCANLPNAPVVLPTENADTLNESLRHNILSLPNPQVLQTLLPILPILAQGELLQLFVTSLLPASYAHIEQVGQLAQQTATLLNGIPLNGDTKRLAFDVFPREENIVSQLQKQLFGLEQIIFHQVQVPVFYGISQKVSALFDRDLDENLVLSTWQKSDLLCYHQDLITPIKNGENEQNQRPKLHLSNLKITDREIEFWTVADDIRFNLAYCAVKLLQRLCQG